MKVVESFIVLFSFAILAKGQTSISFLEPNCGTSISGSRSRSLYKDRILGGQAADMYGNPWMAYIRSSGSMCGGSLITNRFVLTAGHCIKYGPTVVYLGKFDMSSPYECSERGCLEVPVDLQIPHPDYTNGRLYNDIGLLRLATSVQYTAYIRPICLLTNHNPLNDISSLTVTGWGLTEYGIPSDVLKTHTVRQVDRSYCAEEFRDSVDMSQICVYSANSKTCKGDSGSPLSSKYNYRTVQFGLVSYGNPSCMTTEVFTNVMHHMGWIAQVVQEGGSQVSYPSQGATLWNYIG